MIERHWMALLPTATGEQSSPRIVEGLNNKIRVLQRRAYDSVTRNTWSQNSHLYVTGTLKCSKVTHSLGEDLLSVTGSIPNSYACLFIYSHSLS